MKIIYFDCFSGISGDMILGAFLDLCVDQNVLLELPKKLKLEQVNLDIKKVNRNGISATKVDVKFPHEHVHRHLADIEKIIDNADLNDKVKIIAKNIFLNLAKAEAEIHGTTIDKIHFHEVGALDAIFDIVGAASCFVDLNVEDAYVGQISVGGGMVKMAHGLYPVPAPATAILLQGFSIKNGPIEKELVTPTGAAILSVLVKDQKSNPALSILKTGFGAGTMENKDIPNVLRVHLAEIENKSKNEEALLLETNIDDMNTQLYPNLIDKILNAGAYDVYLTPILMKKGRPAHVISVLCNDFTKEKILEILYLETTTIGVRISNVIKNSIPRKLVKLSTTFGEMLIKEIELSNNKMKRVPEFDECLRIANEKELPVKFVYEKIYFEINNF